MSKPSRVLQRLNGSIGRAAAAAIAISVLVVAAAVAVVAKGARHDSVAAWIESLSTVGALVAALIAAIYAGRAFELEGRREDDRIASQRREQASRVAAWTQVVGVRLINRSELPVYDIRVLALIEGEPVPMGRAVLPPTEINGVALVTSRFSQVLNRVQSSSDELMYMRSPTIRATLEFRDAVGVLWQRDHKGNLYEVKTEAERLPDPDDEFDLDLD